jgi:hypothetical protein
MIFPWKKEQKSLKEAVSMRHIGFEEEASKERRAIVNYSIAVLKAIRSYGFAATLDLVVRISNYDPVVNELLPYFPSIASIAMLDYWTKKPE